MKLLSLASLVSLSLAACGGKSTPAPAPVGSTGGDRGGTELTANDPAMTDGALWTCQIGDYDPQPCKLSRTDDGWRLAKLLGSQRFKGTIAWRDPATADFAGQFHCPWGACDEPMNVTFTGVAADLRTDFGGDTISLRYDDALASEWGGAGYGNLTGDEQ